jgi:hypothetical protein
VVVIGSGAAGAVSADLLSRLVDTQCIASSGEPGRPPADTQRNHAWLQSGLLYETVALGRLLNVSGRALLDRYHLPPPRSPKGLFAFSVDEPDKIDEFRGLVNELKLTSTCKAVPTPVAEAQLGPCFVPGRAYFRVPDSPFDEGEMLRAARSAAAGNGAVTTFLPGSAPIELHRGDDGQAEVVIRGLKKRLQPKLVVTCAGAGTTAFLDSLDVPNPGIRTFRSALLRAEDRPMPRCLLFVDRSSHSGLSIVQHGRQAVVGGRHKVDAGDPPSRVLSQVERDAVFGLLPESLQKRWDGLDLYTSGLKTEFAPNGIPSVEPYVAGPDSHGVSNLIVALPGKATAALYLAEQIQELACRILGLDAEKLKRSDRRSSDRRRATSVGVDPQTSSLHFDDFFRQYTD